MTALNIVNGTYIVPFNLPASFRTDELDKLGYNAVITLTWPTIMGGIALLLGARDWRKYSYTPLCIAWLWSVALVAFGIFSRFGRFDHFLVFLSIQHVQFEWLIITYLLGYSFYWGFINATLIGLILYLTDLGLPGIRPTFTVITIGGGWGDVFIALLLWNGRQRILALGAVGHFMNALVTFVAFVQYIPIGSYLALELLFGGMHIICTVGGILRLQRPPIHLDEEGVIGCDSKGGMTSIDHTIPPPSRRAIIGLGLVALLLSLGASLPLNFAPKL